MNMIPAQKNVRRRRGAETSLAGHQPRDWPSHCPSQSRTKPGLRWPQRLRGRRIEAGPAPIVPPIVRGQRTNSSSASPGLGHSLGIPGAAIGPLSLCQYSQWKLKLQLGGAFHPKNKSFRSSYLELTYLTLKYILN